MPISFIVTVGVVLGVSLTTLVIVVIALAVGGSALIRNKFK
jgi:UPF0716 family protein affecting phage T7 exclusion